MKEDTQVKLAIIGAVVSMAVIALLIAGFFNKISRHDGPRERWFDATILSVEMVEHNKVDCPQINQSGRATNVVRIELDREIPIWSEDGTGYGEDRQSKYIDLRTDSQAGQAGAFTKLIKIVGKGPIKFHYGKSFLSICDTTGIPVISNFDIQ